MWWLNNEWKDIKEVQKKFYVIQLNSLHLQYKSLINFSCYNKSHSKVHILKNTWLTF